MKKTTIFLAIGLLLFTSPAFSLSPIDIKYRELRGANGFLGQPIGNESRCAHNKQGRYRHYQGGTIYWHPDTGAHEVHGVIREKYRSLKEYWGVLGFPTTDQMTTPDRIGHYNHFQNGSIYHTSYTGAHEVHGAIRAKWAGEGWERRWIGYPESDEVDTPDGGRYNRFQRGYIVWTPQSGAKAIGFGPTADRTDPYLDFAKLDKAQNPTLYDGFYGNLKDFYENMKSWYGIDLREGVIKRRNRIVSNIRGWQFADFWRTNKLNGTLLSERARFVITVAELVLMQWHLRDLRKHKDIRISQIDRYFKSPHGFKRNWSGTEHKWKYNKWCSEFASYVYKRAGTPVYLNERQKFVSDRGRRKLKAYEDLGWCISTASYFRSYFRYKNRYDPIADIRNKNRRPPQLGDYICTKEHSMLVLGFKPNRDKYINSQIYIVEGNHGTGLTQSHNRRLNIEWISLNNQDLIAVGRKMLK